MIDLDIKFNLDLDILDAIDKKDLKLMGEYVKIKVLDNTSKGISSVGGEVTRFPGYKDPDIYPNGKHIKKQYPEKRQRPVNLNLSGDMLKSMKVNTVKSEKEAGFSLEITDEKYQTHHYGLNGVPQRKIIPIADGEKFSKSIESELKKQWDRVISKAVARLNKGSS